MDSPCSATSDAQRGNRVRFFAAGRKTRILAGVSAQLRSQRGAHFNGINDLHNALEQVTELSKSRELSDELKNLGSCFTLGEVARAGILNKKQASKFHHELDKKRRTEKSAFPSEEHQENQNHVLTLWELCEQVGRPTFSFAGDAPKDADSDSLSDEGTGCHSTFGNDGQSVVRGPWQSSLRGSKSMVGAVRAHEELHAEHRDNAVDSADFSVAKGTEVSQELCHHVTRESHACSKMMPQCEPYTGHQRHQEVVVEGTWVLGKCDGADSAQNPQVQLQAERLAWMGADLLVTGPCGKTVQLWILKRSRWGVRRPKLVHVLALVTQNGEPHGPRHIRCECEIPSNEVITVVLACDGGACEKGKNQEHSHCTKLAGNCDASMHHLTPSTWKRGSALFINEADSSASVPSFRLTITTSQPLARGPVLLVQRQKREDPELASGDRGHDVPLHSDQPRSPSAAATTASASMASAEIDTGKIPIFAEAYLHAAEGLEEKIVKGLEDASALCCRRTRQAYIAETKQVLASHRQ